MTEYNDYNGSAFGHACFVLFHCEELLCDLALIGAAGTAKVLHGDNGPDSLLRSEMWCK